MRSRLPGLVVLIAVLIASVAPPVAAFTPPPVPIERVPVKRSPHVSAAAWILYDDTYGVTLDSSGADEERPMASTTKIMTALVALEQGDPGQMATISQTAADVGESEIGLVAGEQIPIELLVRTLLVRSANDAAMAVAEAVGGSVSGFVDLMNQRATEMGLAHTHFENPHGLDAEGHYSSPRDLLTMARVAMQNPVFAEAVRAERVRLPNAPDGSVRIATATNRLLEDYPGAIGVKTGFTGRAGLVLVSAAERAGRRLYAVVMGSEGQRGHFADVTALLDHGFDDYVIVAALATGQPIAGVQTREDTLERRADLAAMLQLATLGLTGSDATLPGELAPPPELMVVPRATELPGMESSLAWVGRYWEWITGRG